MKKIVSAFFAALMICVLFVSCENVINGKQEDTKAISFALANLSTVRSASLSTGDGDNTVAFSQLTGHKIRLTCTDGSGYCSLSGAKDGFVAWPTASVQLGYGTWTVYAQGYKTENTTDVVYYQNTTGVTFIVGPRGVSIDSGTTWGSSISIAETYCNTASAKIKVNSSLTVKNESETTITLGAGNYSGYQLKWYKTTTANPTNLTTAGTISELTAAGTDFTEWTTPTSAINVGSNTYVLVAIVANTNPSTIFGSVAVKLENLSSGMTYTIGSGNSDYVQFGKYGVEFDEPSEPNPYPVGSIGPAGGYIIYDCDADNDSTNDGAGPDKLKSTVCGWRYIESSPTIMYISTPESYSYFNPKIGGSVTEYYWFSYGEWTQYSTESMSGLSSSIGTGKENTDRIVNFLGSGSNVSGYTYDSNGVLSLKSSINSFYAAKLCNRIQYNYNNTVFSDWYLPSFDELKAINDYIFVKEEKPYPVGSYMSSSEYREYDEGYSYGCRIYFFTDDPDYEYEADDYRGGRRSPYYVIPVRRFALN